MEEKLAAIQSELEGAAAHLADDDEWNSMLDIMSKFSRYSFGNQMLIALQTKGQATRVAGFRKWEEVHRSVSKGEKAITILAPKKLRVTEKDSTGKQVIGPDGKPTRKTVITGFTTASVFDVSQTTGEDVPGLRQRSCRTSGFRSDHAGGVWLTLKECSSEQQQRCALGP